MPCAADKFQSSAIPKIERGTLRVAAPFEYRQQYVDRDSAQKVLTCMANWPHDSEPKRWLVVAGPNNGWGPRANKACWFVS